MAHLYFSANIESGRSLYLSVLSDKMLALLADECLDPSCYYLYEVSEANGIGSVEIIACIHSEEAAVRLSGMVGLS